MTRQPPDLPRRDGRAAPPERPARDGATPPADGAARRPMPPRRAWLTFLLILGANILLVRLLFPNPGDPVKLPYTLFRDEVAKRNVAAIYSRGASITGRFRAPVT
jgi:cell division protease FtsH